MKILYTGFEPFGGEAVNASGEALRLLPDAIAGAQVLRLELPVVFGAGARALVEALERHRPDCAVCVGQAGGRAAVTPEYVAINHCDARIPDNAGQQPRDCRILEEGPAGIFTRLPVRRIVERCAARGIPAQISYTAGCYVCNEVMYRLLYAAEQRFPELAAGFIHVPCTPAQAAAKDAPTPSMEPSRAAEALVIAGEEALDRAKALRAQK